MITRNRREGKEKDREATRWATMEERRVVVGEKEALRPGKLSLVLPSKKETLSRVSPVGGGGKTGAPKGAPRGPSVLDRAPSWGFWGVALRLKKKWYRCWEIGE